MIYGIYRHGSAKYVLEFGISKIFLWALVSAVRTGPLNHLWSGTGV